jgi:hypothetical protein
MRPVQLTDKFATAARAGSPLAVGLRRRSGAFAPSRTFDPAMSPAARGALGRGGKEKKRERRDPS